MSEGSEDWEWNCFIPQLFFQGWYLYIITTRWFGMRIDIISVILLTAVVFASIPLSTGTQSYSLYYRPSEFVKMFEMLVLWHMSVVECRISHGRRRAIN